MRNADATVDVCRTIGSSVSPLFVLSLDLAHTRRRQMPSYYAELVEIMRAHDCHQVPGGKGSHEKWRSPINNRVVTVPRSKSRHTANEVLKQLGIGKKF